MLAAALAVMVLIGCCGLAVRQFCADTSTNSKQNPQEVQLSQNQASIEGIQLEETGSTAEPEPGRGLEVSKDEIQPEE